jgi:hypothetical protein
MQQCHRNVVAENSFVANRIEALDLHGSTGNRQFFNNYLTTGEFAAVSDLPTSANDSGIAAGGSYYAAYDEPAEGCRDADGDGFCDAPYEFPGISDARAFVRANGWLP